MNKNEDEKIFINERIISSLERAKINIKEPIKYAMHTEEPACTPRREGKFIEESIQSNISPIRVAESTLGPITLLSLKIF